MIARRRAAEASRSGRLLATSAWVTGLLVAGTPAMAQGSEEGAPAPAASVAAGGAQELTDLSLEELLSQQVTSAAKKPQRVSDTAAAVYVINQGQIAQSSARTLSDLLRMVPGFQVSDVQASGTAVSARGFASRYAANILVMVDGAAIYGSSLAGIFWDQAILSLQDIERIEVIRGPGGALWGSNSVNGVVNIITKQGIDTQGVRGNVRVGNDGLRAEAGAGVKLAEGAYAHVYGTHLRRDGRARIGSDEYRLQSDATFGGIRFDLTPSPDDTIVALAEHSRTKFEDVLAPYRLVDFRPVQAIGIEANTTRTSHVLARWTRSFSAELDVTFQGYYNYLRRAEAGGLIKRDLYDASVDARWRAAERHELNFGVSGRIAREKSLNAGIPGGGTDRWLTGYIQDQISIVPDRLLATVGSKFEVNNFGASNVQPSARILYRASPSTTLWASVSRAVRTPLLSARAATHVFATVASLDGGVPVYVVNRLRGNPAARSESLVSLEAGIRGGIAAGWSYDVTAFYNRYKHMATQDVTSVAPYFIAPLPYPVGLETTVQLGNASRASSKGVEALVSGTLASWWHVEASYAFLDLRQKLTASDAVSSRPVIDGSLSARHQLRLRNVVEIGPDVNLSGFLQHVSKAPGGQVPAYTKLDLRAAWAVTPRLEVAVGGADLLDRRRVESPMVVELPTGVAAIRRSGYLEARLRF